MPKAAANFQFIPQIYPASEPIAVLRGLRVRFIRVDIRQLVGKPVGGRALTREFRELLLRICGITGFCVRSTLRYVALASYV
jgi:hypothetical protein